MNMGVSAVKWGSVMRAVRALPWVATTSNLSAGEVEEGRGAPLLLLLAMVERDTLPLSMNEWPRLQ